MRAGVAPGVEQKLPAAQGEACGGVGLSAAQGHHAEQISTCSHGGAVQQWM